MLRAEVFAEALATQLCMTVTSRPNKSCEAACDRNHGG